MKAAARDNGIDKKILFHHHVNDANWSSKEKRWNIKVTANQTEQKTFSSRFFLMCTGYYDYTTPLQTIIPGIDDFKGEVVHPQFWPKDLDYKDKEVVIVGSGATAITLVPAMADKVKHVTMLQRSPSYLVSLPKEDGLEKVGVGLLKYRPFAEISC
jgi:cation diffusion facilitator CzcD-associated flavoprotein CzcO